jgi:hypothetical protein
MSVRVEVDDEPKRRGPQGLAVAFWLLLALLLGFAFWLLLNACGLRMIEGSPLLYFCPAPVAAPGVDPALAGEIARQRALEGEIERLELALLRAPPCTAPSSEERSEIPADIPEEAWRDEDVGFLEGCWELASDYALTAEDTGQTVGVADWRACFDASGRGHQDLTFDDGSACGGPMSAEFAESERLVLRDGANVPCTPQSFIGFIYERVITCERVDAAQAHCLAVHPETGGQSNVTLRRAASE